MEQQSFLKDNPLLPEQVRNQYRRFYFQEELQASEELYIHLSLS